MAVISPVGSKETADKLVQTAVKEFGKLDILVNNAGITSDAMVHKMTEQNFDEVIRVRLRGTFMKSQAAFIYMRENKMRDRIVNITSSSGMYGNVGQANYCAAEAGIIGLTKSNSREFARYGICVNAVAAATRTTQRLGEPEDIAPAIIFLASDDSYYVTGQVIAAMGFIGSH